MKTFWVLALAVIPSVAQAARLKELADVEGFRPNPLVGVGIVVGLGGSGDDPSSFLAKRPLATIMKHLGTNIDPAEIRARNVAAVMVTASLPPFARPGVSFDVTISSIGTARSLAGGTLIATALKGLDRETYAIAQGALTAGGWEIGSSASASYARKNSPTAARIPGGAIVEREVPHTLPSGEVVLHLREPDFTTAARISAAISKELGEKSARVVDPGVVSIVVSEEWKDRVVELIAKVEAIEAEPDAPARVVIDERTGTVVAGAAVTLGSAAIAYGGLYVDVRERLNVSQPSALANGSTQVVPESTIQVSEESRPMNVVPAAATVGDVAKALNALGVKPRDLISILEALARAGALRAKLEVL